MGRPVAGLAVCSFVVALIAVTAAAQKLPDGPGRELFETICSECHEPTKVLGQQKTKEEWQAKVTEMLQEDPDVTEQERQAIVNFLAASFPRQSKVNVNHATAREIESGLSLSGKEAEAIVQYREHNGNFKTIDDLKSVPGVDRSKLDSARSRIDF
jgi:competence protein ComEA